MKLGMAGNRFGIFSRFGTDCYQTLKALGYDGIDFATTETDDFLYTLSEQELERVLLEERNMIESAGMEIHQVHGPWRHPTQDATPENRAERMEKMEKSIRMASMLGSKNWIIHPLFPFGEEDATHAAATWDINLEFMQRLLQYAKAHDVTICFENMPFLHFSLARPADILRFVKTINDDHFKICLDTGHANVFDDLTAGDSVRLLKDEIRAFHIHDNKWNMDMHLTPYYGTVDWADFGAALKEIDYQGVFSLEVKLPGSLPSPMFEEHVKTLAKIAKQIMP